MKDFTFAIQVKPVIVDTFLSELYEKERIATNKEYGVDLLPKQDEIENLFYKDGQLFVKVFSKEDS